LVQKFVIVQNSKMKFFLIIGAVTLLTSCSSAQNKPFKVFKAQSAKPAKNEAVATFGEGCFWHAEIIFQSLYGVRDAVSGYAGGFTKNPTYQEVASQTTGHAEVVNVYYDPTKISYETLVKAFFGSMDPTQVNRQGNDVGPEYRSVAFYRSAEEKKILEAEIKRISDAKIYKSKIVTEVVPFTIFYEAEDYHQEYAYFNPNQPYVKSVSLKEYFHFRETFKGKFWE
jgi:peptide-methionine (S)-S-oxide reductase